MEDMQVVARDFIAHLDEEERRRLYNDLLAVYQVYHQNSMTSFYTMRLFKKILHRDFQLRKRTLQYQNQRNDELVIHQIHSQHFFKHSYQFKVFYNLKELQFSFIDLLLTLLKYEHQNSVLSPEYSHM